MYITDIDELVGILRTKLKPYLSLMLGEKELGNKFKCFAHDDNDPSMHFNPKTNYETVKCFSCGWHGDIFDAAAEIESLPKSGPEWVTETLPALAERLGIPYSPGELSPGDKERLNLYRLAQDISDILAVQLTDQNEYLLERNWIQSDAIVGSINPDALISLLVAKGWDAGYINTCSFIRTRTMEFFGEDKVTFAIKNHRGKTLGFICRNSDESGLPKYVNSPESSIYKKNQALLGMEIAYKHAKKDGLFVVEGPGDLMQLYRLGIKNAVAVCGVAFTENHLLYLKNIGIRKIFLNFDWDAAGISATQRVLENILKVTSGVSAYIVEAPENGAKDPDEFLAQSSNANDYLSLPITSAFEWQLKSFSDNETPDVICQKMIPIIAAEQSAIKREILTRFLSNFLHISEVSINADVNNIRNNKFNEKVEKLKASAEEYIRNVSDDPDNIKAHIAVHEHNIESIEKQYRTNTIGINYQLSRYDAIQQQRLESQDDESSTCFKMTYFSDFANNLNGGMNWASGCLIYVGGRANSGKTATCLMIGCDIAYSDPNAIVIIHSTDDSYEQIEPRIKTNLYYMAYPDGPPLSIGMVVQPNVNMKGMPEEYWTAYQNANEVFRQLIEEERLVIIDSEDGATLSTLEQNLKYYRQRHPNKKVLMVCDNTHNYLDFTTLDQSTRMTMISNFQKNLTTRYRSSMIATAEYRKNMPMDNSKMKLPVDDDLADARALMYRPNVIFHVYNDMHDRKEHAEIFWRDIEDNIRPRLLLHFTKNKISGFKEKLIVDLNPSSVTLKPIDVNEALTEAENFRDLKQNGRVSCDGRKVMYLDAEDYTGD